MDNQIIAVNLQNLGYAVHFFETGAEAADYLEVEVKGKTVGFGGSITAKELGLYERLQKENHTVWHWVDGAGKEIRNEATRAQVYITSANAIAETGEIVNIDGTGNRLAATLYGPEVVYIIVGRNKLCGDYDSALYRARNVAAPLNAKRLNRKTPCTVDLKCHDCKSADRICHGLAVLWRPMEGVGRTEVLIVNEDLGM